MTLYERLARAKLANEGAQDEPTPEQPDRDLDPLSELKRKTHQALVQKLGPKLYDMEMTAAELERRVRQQLTEVLEEDETPLSNADRARLISETTDDILGYGPLEPFLRDGSVTEKIGRAHV